MSTVILDTITGKSTATTITIGSTPVVSASANSMTIRGEGSAQTSIQQGLAKAWLSLDSSGGSTTTFHGGFNVTSVLDDAVGQYGLNFTNNMSGATYSTVGSANSSSTYNVVTNWSGVPNHYTTSRTGIGVLQTNTVAYADSDVCISVFGDLA